MTDIIGQLTDVLSPNSILSGKYMDPHLTDWMGDFKGEALVVVRPSTTQEVSQIVRICRKASVVVVPQGGNTGLVGAATPRPASKNFTIADFGHPVGMPRSQPAFQPLAARAKYRDCRTYGPRDEAVADTFGLNGRYPRLPPFASRNRATTRMGPTPSPAMRGTILLS